MGLPDARQNVLQHAARQTRAWLLPACVGVTSVLLEVGGAPVRELLRYDRLALAGGEWWRLASGHFVHLGWSHALLNVVALLAIWALVGARLTAARWLLVIGAVLAGIDAGFWWLDPGLRWYVGLSGLLHGLLAAGLVAGWHSLRTEAWVLAVLLAAKLCYEQLAGPLPGSVSTAGGPVVVNAHLYGALSGLAAGGMVECLRRVKVRASRSL